jgi:Tol biopolymer transport system component
MKTPKINFFFPATLFLILFLSFAITLLTGCGGGGRGGSNNQSTKIVFTRRDSNNEIYIVDINGSNQNRLTDNISDENYPSISPNGNKIAFLSNYFGKYGIFTMNIDGTDFKRLNNDAALPNRPVFSPDSSKIAFVNWINANHEIYIMNTDGSNQIRLTNNTVDDDNPVFSPDDSKIMFESKHEIYIMNIDGSNQIRLTDSTNSDSSPVFSPDGSKIAFVRRREGTPELNDKEFDSEIYIMNVDGSDQTRLTNNKTCDMAPVFAPDGSKIVYQSDPDGGYLSYDRNDPSAQLYYRTGNDEISIMNVDGSNQVRLTNNITSETSPIFSPDGSKIIFMSNRDIPYRPEDALSNYIGGQYKIYTIDIEGNNFKKITKNQGDNHFFNFAVANQSLK